MNETLTKTKTNFMKKITTLVAKKKDILVIILAVSAFVALITITAIYMSNHPSVLG